MHRNFEISNGTKHIFTCKQKSASEIYHERSSLMVKTHCENGLFNFKGNIYSNNCIDES